MLIKNHPTSCNKSTFSTQTSAQDISQSEDANNECSHDTIQYFLKIQCDDSKDPHKLVTTPQLNAFDMSKMLAEHIKASRLPVKRYTI